MKVPIPSPNSENVSSGATSQEQISCVKDRLLDAMDSSIFLCGVAPLDPDDPCYGIFLCDTSLDCDSHVEAEFYMSVTDPNRKELCCHCAGVCDSPIELNSSRKAPIGPYSVALPICKACLDEGHTIIVRVARQHASAKRAKMQTENARELARAEVATAQILTKMAFTSIGSLEADMRSEQPPVSSAITPKTGRKTR